MTKNNNKGHIHEQIKNEFYSAYIYYTMSAYLAEIGLVSVSKQAKIQAGEKINRGINILEHLNSAYYFSKN